MANSGTVHAKLQEWRQNFELQGQKKLAEFRSIVNVADVFEEYCQEIAKLPEGLRKTNLYEFMATCEATNDVTVEQSTVNPSVSQEAENKSRAERQQPGTWKNRLRGQRKLPAVPFTPSDAKTPVYANSTKPIVLKTPTGNVRLPHAITPKVQSGTGVKFRTLRREEVAFSVAGTPVVAVDDADGDESVLLVNELLHANDNDLTPKTRDVVHGMKQLIGKMRASEIPRRE